MADATFLERAKGSIKRMLTERWSTGTLPDQANRGAWVQVIKAVPSDDLTLFEISDGGHSCGASIANGIVPASEDAETSTGPPARAEIIYVDSWHRVPSDPHQIKILSCRRSADVASSIYGNPRKAPKASADTKETMVLVNGENVIDLLSLLRVSGTHAARLLTESLDAAISQRPVHERSLFYGALVSSLISQQSLSFFLARSTPHTARAVGRHLTESHLSQFLANFTHLSSRLSLSDPIPHFIENDRLALANLELLLAGIERVARQPARKLKGKAADETPVDPYTEEERDVFEKLYPYDARPVEKADLERKASELRGRCEGQVELLITWLATCNDSYQAAIDRVFLECLATPPTPPRAPEPKPVARAPKLPKRLKAPVLAPPTLKSDPNLKPKVKRNRAPTNDGPALLPVSTSSSQPPSKKSTKKVESSFRSRTKSSAVPPVAPDVVAPPTPLVPAEKLAPPPPIMPLRAARLFDSSSSDFGAWQIVLSGRSIKDWQGLKDPVKTHAVETVLVELSNGYFSSNNQKALIHESDVTVYEAKVLSDMRLVYQIDLEDGMEGESVKQLIRVWGLESHSTLDKRVWSAVLRHTASRGAEYRRRVTYRLNPIIKGPRSQPISLPATFPAVVEEAVGVVENTDLNDAEQLKVHELLALGKYIPFSRAVARSVLAQDEEAVHLFQLSPLEKKVVYHESSAFVIGRSGTGKTTSILLRILSYQKAEEQHPELMGGARLRSIFITQSNLLASKVRKYYDSIWRTFASAGLTPDEAAKLAMARANAAKDDLEDVEDESAGLRGLPSRFSELGPEHFPLFISWDTLLLLLENNYDVHWGGKRARSEAYKQTFRTFELQREDRGGDVMAQLGVTDIADDLEEPEDTGTPTNARLWDHYVDAAVFASWFPHFPAAATKGIDPALCWSEILGTICGSEAAIDTKGGYLSRQQYLSLSERGHSTYVSHRDAVYTIFEAYRARKNQQHDFDRSERTHQLIRKLREEPIPHDLQLQHVSVDEAQDLLLVDFRLLRYLCDLKAAMYRQEEAAAILTGREPVNPEIFKLSLNYRSHCGITRMADSLVRAITRLFPNTIDQLPPETGKVDGPAPVWIVSAGQSESESRSFSSFLFGESGSPVEFGAEQCILVRNDQARERLRARTGDMGLIMTIAESKGLEFTDVLLFDFFSDSPASAAEWRVILTIFRKPGEGIPTMDPIRHAIVCQELRFLYVACTRARSILWFAERDLAGDAVRQYFEHEGVIRICNPSDDLPTIAATSSPDQWSKQARVMYDRQLYRNAAFCYDKAGLFFEKSVAEAFEARRVLRASARKSTRANPSDTSLVAAKFRSCAENAPNIQQGKKLYRPCADLYLAARRHEEAARAFELADEFDQSALVYLGMGERFTDDAVRVARTGRTTAATRDKVFKTARLHYLKHRQLDRARALFEDDDELVEYMTDFDFDDARVDFYVSVERFTDAAELELAAGHLQKAADLFHRGGDRSAEARTLVQLVAELVPIGSEDTPGRSQRVKSAAAAIASAREAQVGLDDVNYTRELERYSALIQDYRDIKVLLPLAADCATRRDTLGQLHCLDYAFDVDPDFNAPDSVRRWLQAFANYIALIKALVSSPPSDDALRLFGAETNPSRDEVILVAHGPLAALEPTAASEVSRDTVSSLINRFILNRLEKRLTDMSHKFMQYSAIRVPCLEFTVLQTCSVANCHRAHVATEALTKQAFQDRLGPLSLILDLLPALSFIALRLPDSDVVTRERIKNTMNVEQARWDSVFVQTLFPPLPCVGGLLDAQESSELDETTKKLALRAEDRLFGIGKEDRGCWYNLLSSTIVGSHFAPEAFRNYSRRVPVIKWPKGPFYLPSDRNPTTQILTSFLSTEPTADLKADFLRHVLLAIHSILEKSLAVDVSLLVYTLEDFASLALLRTRFGAVNDRAWNGVIAPKDLLRRMYRRHSQRNVVEFNLSTKRGLFRVLELAATLVYEGARALLFDGVALKGTGEARHVFALRIIRLMVLIGMRSQLDVKAMVRASLGRLHELGPRTWSSLTDGFYKAATSDFAGLEIFLATVTNRFELDSLVGLELLGHTSLPRGCTPIRVKSLAAVEARLFPGALSAKAAPFVPARPSEPAPSAAAFDASADEPEAEEGPEPIAQAPALSPEQEARKQARDAEEQAREDAASRTIVAHVRKYAKKMKARKEHDKMPHVALWTAYKSLVSKPPLRPVVLGPLVEIAFALQGQVRRIQSTKTVLKEILKKAEGDDLLKVGEQTTQINNLRKTLDKLLEPISVDAVKSDRNGKPGKPLPAKPMLQNGKLLELRIPLKGAREVFNAAEALLCEIHRGPPQPKDAALAAHFAIGEKGILVLPKPKADKPKERKPELGSIDAIEVEGDEDEVERIGRERARV